MRRMVVKYIHTVQMTEKIMKYDSLSKELTERIEHDRMTGSRPNVGFREQDAVRRSAAD